ncbi:MAG TPA: GntR family transcriptional regulator, partial [Modicisalibacter sp.]|nr:GntR family transcriptional regulator [Modicisalibacter sp.]
MTTKRSDKIAELIRQRILTGELKPGQALSNEAALIDRFSTSKWTLREALKSLETQGLIKIRSGPGGGASVTEVGADKANELLWNYCFSRELTLENIYALRKELEPLLAAQVTPLLSDDDLTRLSAMAERCCAYKPTGRGQPERATELDFHNLLAKRCPNPLLGFLIEFINELLMRIVEAQHLDPELAQHDLNYHGHDYHLDLIEA